MKIIKLIAKNNSGFTLLELLIYIFILAVTALMIADAFIIFSRGQGQVESRTEVNSNLRFVLEKIKKDISSASTINIPSNPGDASSTLEFAVGADTIRYYVADAKVLRKVNSLEPEQMVSDKVKASYFNVLKLENTNSVLNKKRVTVGIELTVGYNSDSPDWQFSQTKRTAFSLPLEL